MFAKVCVILILLSGLNYVKSGSREEQCIDYYETGNDYDINKLTGKWYSVYLWPPSPRQRDNCEVINFKKLTKSEVDTLRNNCTAIDSGVDTMMQATYKNTAGKLNSVTYYGEEEIKHLYRSCDRISKYIFFQINDDYVMGINCSSGGRGILLSRVMPTTSQVETLVQSIEIMTGRDGSPDCNLL